MVGTLVGSLEAELVFIMEEVIDSVTLDSCLVSMCEKGTESDDVDLIESKEWREILSRLVCCSVRLKGEPLS